MSSMSEEEPVFVVDDQVWFADGNIIVSAGVKEVSLFKCHQSLLSKHSEVFKDMFTLPPTAIMETYQGLPKVHLPDPAEDVRALLRMLYDPTELPYISRDNATATNIRGPLVLAKKYMMTSIFDRLSEVVKRDWPTSFHGWRLMQLDIRNKIAHDHQQQDEDDEDDDADDEEERFTAYDKYYPDPAPVIRLAREACLDQLLPVAFYELQKWYPPYPVFVEEDGEHVLHVSVRDEHLSKKDLQCLIMGAAKLDASVESVWPKILHSTQLSGCREGNNLDDETKACWAALNHFVSEAKRHHRRCRMQRPRDPIWMLDKVAKTLTVPKLDDSITRRICVKCRSYTAAVIEEQQEAIWDSFADLFECPS